MSGINDCKKVRSLRSWSISFLTLIALLTPLVTSSANAQTTIVDSIFSGGTWRHYRLYLPANYGAGGIRPLILNFHGYGETAASQQLFSRTLMRVADTAGFLIAYPEGLPDGQGKFYWNVGLPYLPNTDDVGFVSSLIDTLAHGYTMDLSRLYATGISLGGFMSYELACKLPRKIAAIASVSGSLYPSELAVCNPGRPVPVMEIHGTADDVIPYDGKVGLSVDVDTLVQFWVLNNRCLTTPSVTQLADADPADGSNVEHLAFVGGLENATVELYRIIGGGHVDWPGAGAGNNGDFDASVEIWKFFSKYTIRQFAGLEEQPADMNSPLTFCPNPAIDRIRLSRLPEGNVDVMDMLGRLLLTSYIGNLLRHWGAKN